MRDLKKSPSRKPYARHARHRRGGSRFGTLLVLTAMTAGGVYGYRHYFHRGGEDAVHLIPADALMVVTIDATPAPGQALTFKRIGDAVKAEHLDTQLEEALSRSLSDSPLARDLRPFATGSFAFATLKSTDGAANRAEGAILAAISDADKVGDVLARDAQKKNSDGLDYYQAANDTRCMAVIGSYLVTADKPGDLAQIEAVRKGQTPAIAAQPDYQQARTELPADSNLMLFFSANGISQAAQGVDRGGDSAGLFARISRSRPHARYAAMGMAIHDQGVDVTAQIPLDPPSGEGGSVISHIAPLSDNLWRKLPGGAYGILAFSQPGKYYGYATATASADADARRLLHESAAGFERETGLSVTRDILPAANGDAVLAVYPDADNPQQGADGLIVLDDANSANPAALTDRIRAYAERASSRQGGHTWHFTSENRGGVTIWTLDQNAQSDLQHSLAGSVAGAQRAAGVAPTPDAPGAVPPPPAPSHPTALLPPDAAAPNYMEHHSTPEGGGSNAGSGEAGRGGMDGGSNVGGSGSSDSDNRSSDAGGNAADAQAGGGRGGDGVDIHIHGDGDGRVFDDSFALHHGDESVHIDRSGVSIHSHAGDATVNQEGVHVRAQAGGSVAVNGSGVNVRAGGVSATLSSGGPALTPDVQQAVGNKTIVYAQVGHAALIASSRRMLDRALAAYTNGANTLADDPGSAGMRQRIVAGAQNVALLSLPSILEALRPLMERALADNRMGLNAGDILGLAGGQGEGLVATQQYDGKVARLTFFLPLNYEKAVHLAGALLNRR